MSFRSLHDIAEEEIESVSRHLAAEMASDLRASFLLYQPLPIPGVEAERARLVDVGPRPAAAEQLGRIFQAVTGGTTGRFLRSFDAVQTTIPRSEPFDPSSVETYRRTPVWLRRAQVALERIRYPALQWSDFEGVPESAFIHHLLLSPPIRSAKDMRLPSLGTVYALTEALAPDEHIHRLIHLSQYASAAALRKRLHLLLGDSLLSALCDLHVHGSRWSDRQAQLVAKLVLAHHWFFPYDPVGYQALRAFHGHDDVSAIYEKHEWEPPDPPRDTLTPSCPMRLVERLAIDIQQLALYANDSSRLGDLPDLRPLVVTALCILAGRLTPVHLQRRGATVLECSRPRGSDVVALLPVAQREWVEFGFDVQLPLYRFDKVRQNSKNPRKGARWARVSLAPGETSSDDRHHRRDHLQTEGCITRVDWRGGSFEFAVAPHSEPGDWVKRATRSTLEDRLCELVAKYAAT